MSGKRDERLWLRRQAADEDAALAAAPSATAAASATTGRGRRTSACAGCAAAYPTTRATGAARTTAEKSAALGLRQKMPHAREQLSARPRLRGFFRKQCEELIDAGSVGGFQDGTRRKPDDRTG